jgi:hypothetical protein
MFHRSRHFIRSSRSPVPLSETSQLLPHRCCIDVTLGQMSHLKEVIEAAVELWRNQSRRKVKNKVDIACVSRTWAQIEP